MKNQMVVIPGVLVLLATAVVAASYNAQTAKAQGHGRVNAEQSGAGGGSFGANGSGADSRLFCIAGMMTPICELGLHYIGPLNKTAWQSNGINVLRNVKPTELDFKHWGGKQSSLTIQKIYENGVIPYFFRIDGSSGMEPGGFSVNSLNYSGRYVSLIIGNVTKSSNEDFQVSFVFTIIGDHGNYNLYFVHGPLYLKGWTGNNYYEGVNSYSSRLIDLHHLITDNHFSVRQISVAVPNGSKLAALDFRIDLGRTTENAPVILPGGGLYFVMGNIM